MHALDGPDNDEETNVKLNMRDPSDFISMSESLSLSVRVL